MGQSNIIRVWILPMFIRDYKLLFDLPWLVIQWRAFPRTFLRRVNVSTASSLCDAPKNQCFLATNLTFAVMMSSKTIPYDTIWSHIRLTNLLRVCILCYATDCVVGPKKVSFENIK